MAAPGGQRGSAAASDSQTRDQSGSSRGVISRGMAGRPTVWVSTCCRVAAALPCAPNSGQRSVTGVSYSRKPRATSTCASVAATFLPVEKLKIGVPVVSGRPVAESAVPATASTISAPSRYDGDLHTGLRAGTDQGVDVTLNLVLYLTHRRTA